MWRVLAPTAVAFCVAAAVADADSVTIGSDHFVMNVRSAISSATQQGTINGRIRGLPHTTNVVLESQRGTRWTIIARSRLSHSGQFTLQWHGRTPRPLPEWITLRIAARRNAQVLASLIFPLPRAPIPCQPASAPENLPPGDGWITGGLYESGGGPAPGIPADCSSKAYTVSATNASGQEVASQTVPGGHSYTLVVPAGSYTLRSGSVCRGTATVTAGRDTRADTRCLPFP